MSITPHTIKQNNGHNVESKRRDGKHSTKQYNNQSVRDMKYCYMYVSHIQQLRHEGKGWGRSRRGTGDSGTKKRHCKDSDVKERLTTTSILHLLFLGEGSKKAAVSSFSYLLDPTGLIRRSCKNKCININSRKSADQKLIVDLTKFWFVLCFFFDI